MTYPFTKFTMLIISFTLITVDFCLAGEAPQVLTAYLGTTPSLDGMIQQEEYADAQCFIGVKDWKTDTKVPAQDSRDLSLQAWVKHDGVSLYFAFDVTDDVIYGFDTDRWISPNNPLANEMTFTNGWPWWGDGVEIMMNSTYQWHENQTCAGDCSSWQVVCSTHKSTLGGLGTGGLMAGEPRTATAWDFYESWAQNGDMQAVVRLKENEGRGYIIEWRINPNPCLQIDASNFVDLSKETRVGINFEVQDLDEKERGQGNWSNFHHIDYWAKVGSYSKTALKSFGTLIIKPEVMTSRVEKSPNQSFDCKLLYNYPNPANPSTTLTYHLARPALVALTIYNAAGQTIRYLLNDEQSAGFHSLDWDGKDENGAVVASGIYVYKLAAQDFSQTGKLVVMR
ncbi:T9SS type A sorting domain-containing protein [candidate division KSB1 bacterium]|nr:T9SS type A sorting domain-containing protein [candidate division KSB1 bacterium]